METTNIYAAAPASFAKCLTADCPAAIRCLRRQAALAVPVGTEQMLAINPRCVVPAAGEACPYFRSSASVRRPRGFLRAFNALPRSEAAHVATTLISRLDRRLYYRLRKGELPLNAAQQTLVEEVLIRHGAQSPIVFDAYEEGLDW